MQHLFRKFRQSSPYLHFAAHSHHPWPDASYEAQKDYWELSVKELDKKWPILYETTFPEAQKNVARLLGRDDYEQVAFAPNTHEFVLRIFSLFGPSKKVKVLTTDSEFHSFKRQLLRLKEDELVEIDHVQVTNGINTHNDLSEKLKQGSYDLIFVSQVFFNCGVILPEIEKLIELKKQAIFVVDGYHAMGAIEVDTSSWGDDFFYIGGGYKYLQAGEGCCFAYIPKSRNLRPRNTGWYADFSDLTSFTDKVGYAPGGAGFMGATFDFTAMARFNAVQRSWQQENIGVSVIREHVVKLKEAFIDALEKNNFKDKLKDIQVDNLYEKCVKSTASFLTFVIPNATELGDLLKSSGVIVDARGDRLRFGIGMYQTEKDLEKLFDRLKLID